MSFYHRIRLSGSADIDLHLASKILAEALAVYEDRNVVQQISYGPEARGAAVRTELVISDGEIYKPKAEAIDLFVALNQEAADRYLGDLKEGGTILVDEEGVAEPPQGKFTAHAIPFVAGARALGDYRLANMVVLGAVTVLSPAHSRRSVEDAMLARVPPGTEDVHRAAFDYGFNIMKEKLQV